MISTWAMRRLPTDMRQANSQVPAIRKPCASAQRSGRGAGSPAGGGSQPRQRAYLYTLADPCKGEVRYVGWTSKTPERRLSEHLKDAMRERGTHKRHWLREVLSELQRPVIRTIAVLNSPEEAKRCEIAYIAALKARGVRLTNGTNGGDGALGPEHSRLRGVKRSAEVCENISKAMRGKKRGHLDAVRRAALIAANRRRTFSVEARAAAATRMAGKSKTPEALAKWRAKNIGMKRTPETRAKIGEANHTRIWTAESRAKASRSARNRRREAIDG